MEDKEIIQLYWNRDQNAITETSSKYGNYCTSIARNILRCKEDTEECVNDTYLNTWNSLPPHRPSILSTYLGKITRNLAFDRFRHQSAEKRGGGEINQVLDELSECVSGKGSVEDEAMKSELVRAIDEFLNTLPKKKCGIFLLRYWYAYPISQIADKYGMTDNGVSVLLSRIRSAMKRYLIERGYGI